MATAICFVLGACSPPLARPSDVLHSHADARNQQNLDAVMEAFAPFAVVVGHPLAGGELRGAEAIRRIEERWFAETPGATSTLYTDMMASGDVVTFGHVFYASNGACSSGSGHRVIVDTGKIIRWEWGTHGDPCG